MSELINRKIKVMEQILQQLNIIKKNIVERNSNEMIQSLNTIETLNLEMFKINQQHDLLEQSSEILKQDVLKLKEDIIHKNNENIKLLNSNQDGHRTALQQMNKKVQASQVYNNMRKQYY